MITKNGNARLLLLIFIIIATLVSISSFSNRKNANILNSPFARSGSTIFINQNTGLASHCSGNGSGTLADPYRIENLIFNASGVGSVIEIQSTTLPLIIRNCTILDSGTLSTAAGIWLNYCTNVTIVNCTIISNLIGIYLVSSQYISIIENNISKNSGTGIYFVSSSNNNVTQNLINNNHKGINLITNSQNNIIFANSLKSNAAGNYAWDGSGLGNTWFKNTIGNYWDNYKTLYKSATTTDNVTWNTPYILNTTKNQVDMYPLVSFTAHQPISIGFSGSGNAQLAAFPDITGNGTRKNPYVIQNMVISVPGQSGSCIYLKDITLYLKIYNITCSGGNIGIWLENCANITIDKCKFNFNNEGCHVIAGCKNVIISNSNFSWNTNYGIYIDTSSNMSLRSNYVGKNKVYGIYVDSNCNNCTITNSIIEYNGGIGIFINSGINFNLTGNKVRYNSVTGIDLPGCTNEFLTNNSIINNTNYGINLSSTNNITVKGNDIGGSQSGIFLSQSKNDKFYNNSLHFCSIIFDPTQALAYINSQIINAFNTIDGKRLIYLVNKTNFGPAVFSGAGAIILVNCSFCIINDLVLSPATKGIQLFYSWNCTINNCTCNYFLDSGIYLYESTKNIIENSPFLKNDQAIYLYYSDNNTIRDNLINYGHTAVYLSWSSSNHLRGNQILGCGLRFDGNQQQCSSQDIDQTNHVNNKILYYYANKTSLSTADFTNAGQIWLANCNNATIPRCNLSNATIGLSIYYCNFIAITDVNVSFNFMYGIYLYASSNNTFTSCTIDRNVQAGLYFYVGQGNQVLNCTIISNEQQGIYVSFYPLQTGNQVSNCTIKSNEQQGIYVSSGSIQTIIGNNISYNLNDGIYFGSGIIDSNVIGNNVSFNRGIGIRVIGASGIHIYSNIIAGNMVSEAYSNEGSTFWNSSTIGNCWGDYQERYPTAITTTQTQETPFGLGIIWNTPYAINGSGSVFDYLPFYQDSPLNFHAIGGRSQVTITWHAPAIASYKLNDGTAITGYRIYHGISKGGETFYKSIGNITTYTDTSVTNGKTYYYKIAAVNSAGEGMLSSEVSATPLDVPSAPDLKVIAKDNQIVLNWTVPASNGGLAITGYKIYRGTSPDREIYLTTVGNVTTFTDNGTIAALVQGQIYYYKVSAINGVGEGQQSSEASVQAYSPISLTLWIAIIIVVIGMILVIAAIYVKVRHRTKVTKPVRPMPVTTTPTTTYERPEISIKEALAVDAADMQHRIDEKQAILTRILEPQTTSEAVAAAQQSALLETEALKVKKIKVGASSEEVIEHKVDEKLEQEMKPELQVERCIVCSTALKSTSYVCPECKTKYCIRCAIELSQRNEECWVCKKPFMF